MAEKPHVDRDRYHELGWQVARVWVDALEQTARDFHGASPQDFCRRAYEHAVERWLRTLGDDYGFNIPKAHTLRAALDAYIELGLRAGLFADRQDVSVETLNPNKLGVLVRECQYLNSCRDLLNEGFSLKDLTCPRIGCFCAATEILGDTECSYEVTAVKLDGGCQGIIERA